MSQEEHKAAAPSSVRCFIVTVSDTRIAANDRSGDTIAALLDAANHPVVGRTIVKDDPAAVTRAVRECLANADVQAVLTTGGTGLTSRDSTYEALIGLLDKRLDGFGELFRMLSYQEIGPAAMLSRAIGGTANGKILLSLPGSEGAVRLGMTKLIIPELAHLLQQVSR